METNPRRFAYQVLLFHLILLLVVAAVVGLAARELYVQTRQRAIEQALDRQELLAAQTARGIESYYNSIVADLDLLKRSEWNDLPATRAAIAALPARRELGRSSGAPEGTTRPTAGVPPLRLARILWNQLEGRVSQVFLVNRQTMAVPRCFPDERAPLSREIAAWNRPWLQSVGVPAVSKFVGYRSGGANLVCVPAVGDWLLVAVVPVRHIEEKFLDSMNASQKMSALLLDETGMVMAASDRSWMRKHLTTDVNHANLREMVQEYLRTGDADAQVFDRRVRLATAAVAPQMVAIEPVRLPEANKTWSVLLGSDLGDINAVLNTVFRRVLGWTIFVVISMTAILVSTAVHLIRSRARLERLRHSILQREIAQAREIQLAWLPSGTQRLGLLDVAAANHPAQHISGDFYDWFELPDGRLAVTIGDVTGHGMSAAFLMATTQLLVRTTLPRVMDPGKCLTEVNRQLCIQAFNGQFVTILAAVLDPAGHELMVATAGHPAPWLGANGTFTPLSVEAELVLGVERDAHFTTQRFNLPPQWSLLFYTDGVPDARSAVGEQFSNGRLKQCLAQSFDGAQAMVDNIVAAVAAFRGKRELIDDFTLVAVQPVAAQAANPVVSATSPS